MFFFLSHAWEKYFIIFKYIVLLYTCHGLNPEQLRMGKKDGFNNELTKKLHDISTALIPKTKMSIHENVPEYEEDDYLAAETGFEIQHAVFLETTLLLLLFVPSCKIFFRFVPCLLLLVFVGILD